MAYLIPIYPTVACNATTLVSFCLALHFSPLALRLDNRLQLPRVPQRILNDLVARDQDVLAQVVVLLLWEVYPAVLDHPAALLGEVDNTAF
jgi:hypothetical protein